MIEEEGKFYLYRHIREDKNEVFYVGIGTKHIKAKTYKWIYKRALEYKGRNNLWKKIVNKTNYKVEIVLESNDYDFIQEKEKEFIRFYGRKNLEEGTLCNLTDGGQGVLKIIKSQESIETVRQQLLGRKFSEETKAKMSKSLKGKSVSDVTKQKMSKAQKGKILSEEHKDKISKANKGRIITQETRDKISKTLINHQKTTEHINNIIESRTKHPYLFIYNQLTISGDFIKTFLNPSELKKAGFDYNQVWGCCKGKRKTHKGFKWEQVEYKNNINDNFIKKP